MTCSASARLEVFMAAPPKIMSLQEDQLRSGDELITELRSVQQQLFATHQALQCAIGQLSASNAHCTSIHRELSDVRERLNNVMKTTERGSKKVKARFVTSRALHLEFDEEEAERQECDWVAAEKEKQKELDDAESTRQIADDALNRDFTGRLAAYRKNDLRALAIALSLSDKGTNTELLSRIQNSFEQNPDLKQNLQFSGLFNRSRKNAASNNTEAPDIVDTHTTNLNPHISETTPASKSSTSSYIIRLRVPTNHSKSTSYPSSIP